MPIFYEAGLGRNMPVSLVPIIFPLTVMIGGIVSCRMIKRTRDRCLVIGACSFLVFGVPMYQYAKGGVLHRMAMSGNHKMEFAYAQWLECHCEAINTVVLFPCDWHSGSPWLDRAAAGGYPPAMFTKGVKLKWHGVPSDQERQQGQRLIDSARTLGYNPRVPEENYEFAVYRAGRVDWP